MIDFNAIACPRCPAACPATDALGAGAVAVGPLPDRYSAPNVPWAIRANWSLRMKVHPHVEEMDDGDNCAFPDWGNRGDEPDQPSQRICWPDECREGYYPLEGSTR